jgi:hypothetical protein
MTITVDVPKASEGRLLQEAQQAGLAVPEFVLRLIDECLPAHLNSGGLETGLSLSDE